MHSGKERPPGLCPAVPRLPSEGRRGPGSPPGGRRGQAGPCTTPRLQRLCCWRPSPGPPQPEVQMDSSRCGAGRGEDVEWSARANRRGPVRQTDTPGGSCTARLGDSLALLSSNGDRRSGQWVRPGPGEDSTRGGEGPSDDLGKNQFDGTVTQGFAQERDPRHRRPYDGRLAGSLKGGRCRRRICVSLASQSSWGQAAPGGLVSRRPRGRSQ